MTTSTSSKQLLWQTCVEYRDDVSTTVIRPGKEQNVHDCNKREMFNLGRFSCESGIWQLHKVISSSLWSWL